MENSLIYKAIDDPNLSEELFEKIPNEEKNNEEIKRESRTYLQNVWISFRANKLAMFGLIIIVIIIISAILAPMISNYTYDGQNFDRQNMGPSYMNLFGTDRFGRDIFIRCMYGARISLTIGFTAALIDFCLGTIYGGISGYFGGKVDLVMQRFSEILYGIPQMCYVLLIMMFFGSSIRTIVISLSVTYWIGTSRIVRGEILSLKNQDFIMAAKVIGESDRRIIIRHLIPNCLNSVIVSVTFTIPSAIFLEAFLSFLGIGIQVPLASWGTLANDAIPYLARFPYQMIFPTILISVTMFAFNFVGDGLRDALDPKMK